MKKFINKTSDYFLRLNPDYLLEVRSLLLIGNGLLVFLLILFHNLGVLPLKHWGHFLFFIFIFFLLALYRPGWIFLLFGGTIAIELINLAPVDLGFKIRPYQFLGFLLGLAIIVRLLSRRLSFNLPHWNWLDTAVTVFFLAGFLSFGGPSSGFSIKEFSSFASFALWYGLSRLFLQNFEDLKKVLPFFLSSGVIISLYALWQNIRFSQGLSHFEIMPGRPNSVLTESDWLGLYLVFLLAVFYSTLFYFFEKNQLFFKDKKEANENKREMFFLFGQLIKKKTFFAASIFLFLTLNFTALIITVSRSAWLGALAVSLVFLTLSFKNFFFDLSKRKFFYWNLALPPAAVITGLILIQVFNLSPFRLWERAESTGSGWQKITISCADNRSLPDKIADIGQLDSYNCRHINLEEIVGEQEKGRIVKEIYRPDPNIFTRWLIYQKSLKLALERPYWGVGWKQISSFLGSDERGTPLNASNIFLEVWLGEGILGLLAFLAIWVYIFKRGLLFFRKKLTEEFRTYCLFLLTGAIALLVCNFFNAGIFMGMLWFFWGSAAALQEKLD